MRVSISATNYFVRANMDLRTPPPKTGSPSPTLPSKTPRERRQGNHMTIERIGVVGAGQMGNGIAHVLALAGYDVLMTDTSADALNASHGIIGANIDRQVARDKVSEGEKAEALARIKTTGKLTDLGPHRPDYRGRNRA